MIREYFRTNIIRPCFNLTFKKCPEGEKKKAFSACLRYHRKDIFVEKKLTLSRFFGEKDDELWIFDLLYSDFKDKFDNDNIVFTQKYLLGKQQIHLYHLSGRENIDVFTCLDFLNKLQETNGFSSSTNWSPFFSSYFDAGNNICVYQFVSENENTKRMFEQFCSLAIS